MKPVLIFGIQVIACVLLAAAASAQTTAPSNPPPRGDARPPESGNETLTAEQQAKVKSVLSAYKPASLTAADAKVIKRTLRDAGMRRSKALDAAITAAGFSPERLETLDPRPSAPPPGGGDAPGGAPPPK
jgi:hypothetical protein